MSNLEELGERIERLLQRQDELRVACSALEKERDSLRSRLTAARLRIDALLDRLPDDPVSASADLLSPQDRSE